MKLGITPIVTSGVIMQLLAGTNLIDIDFSLKEDRVELRNVRVYVLSPSRHLCSIHSTFFFCSAETRGDALPVFAGILSFAIPKYTLRSR